MNYSTSILITHTNLLPDWEFSISETHVYVVEKKIRNITRKQLTTTRGYLLMITHTTGEECESRPRKPQMRAHHELMESWPPCDLCSGDNSQLYCPIHVPFSNRKVIRISFIRTFWQMAYAKLISLWGFA